VKESLVWLSKNQICHSRWRRALSSLRIFSRSHSSIMYAGTEPGGELHAKGFRGRLTASEPP